MSLRGAAAAQHTASQGEGPCSPRAGSAPLGWGRAAAEPGEGLGQAPKLPVTLDEVIRYLMFDAVDWLF